jgi:phosphohistidine phosphatase SixA
MDIVLIRHAERRRDVPEPEAGLTLAGQRVAVQTARLLQELSFEAPEPGNPRLHLPKFTAILTSKYAAPRETAGLLAKSSGAAIYELECLTPFHPGRDEPGPNKVFDEANAASRGATRQDQATLAIIGHEPALSDLLCKMTGKDSRSLDRGEAVWLNGQGQKDFTSKKAALVYASRHNNYAEALHGKIETKMTVCTFLAGFTIAALIEIIKDPEKIACFSRILAATSFTFALGLFVAAVYIYDELSMPPPFWRMGKAGGEVSSRTHFGHDHRLNDALYAHMVRVWRVFFTPAVALSVLGFFALLLFNLCFPCLIDKSRTVWWLATGCSAGIIVPFLMYREFKPRLAFD